MKITEIMTEAAVTDRPDDSLEAAAKKMWEQQTGSLLVTDGEELVGIVTERDILRAVGTRTSLDTPLSAVMSKDLITVDPGASIREAARIMTEKWIRHLPVLDGGKLVGIVSQRDLSGLLAGALNEPESLHRLIESSELVRERRLKRIERGDLD
ncbi:MAG TPA: CBS domain-containing protein [Actinomycetota bacterium]|jgi:CBS domain-containing protein|nr:CBS domain-containing protein [Actinomycetota bacterium]